MKIQEIDALSSDLSSSFLMEILDVAKGMVKASLEGMQCCHGLWEKAQGEWTWLFIGGLWLKGTARLSFPALSQDAAGPRGGPAGTCSQESINLLVETRVSYTQICLNAEIRAPWVPLGPGGGLCSVAAVQGQWSDRSGQRARGKVGLPVLWPRLVLHLWRGVMSPCKLWLSQPLKWAFAEKDLSTSRE